MDAALVGEPARRAAIGVVAREAAAAGSAIALFPELATTGYGDPDAIREGAVPVADLAADDLGRLASETGVALCVGMATREDGQLLNSAVFFRPDEPPLVYHKRELYGRHEKAVFAAAREPARVFRYRGLRLGLLVCFDAEFPEHVRALALAGADLVLVPTALPDLPGSRIVAGMMIPVRAFENQIFVAYCGHAGDEGRFRYLGGSQIVGPDGARLADAHEEPARHLKAAIDPTAYERSRRQNPYLAVASTFPGRG